MSLAVNNASDEREFTTRWHEALLRHYKMTGQKIQAGKANENGDVEQRHYRLKRAVDQSLRAAARRLPGLSVGGGIQKVRARVHWWWCS